MAKIEALPAQAIIDGFKGTIDFYLHDGVACVRQWPRSPGRRRAQAVQARWPAFSWAVSNWNSLSTYVQDAYRQTASGSSMSGRDLFIKAFISDYFREGQWD